MRVALGIIRRDRSRLVLLALVAALIAIFALALPAGASAAKYALRVHKTGTGKGRVECEVAASGTVGTCASSYTEGTELVLYATPGEGSVFVEWTDEYCSFYGSEPCELIFEEEPVTVVAEFGPIPKYPLTVKTAGTGIGRVECELAGSGAVEPCAPEYLEGTELILHAVANPGSEFVEWSGDCLNESCDLTVEEEPVAVTAIFKARPSVSFTVIESGNGTGTVTCDGGACASSYSEGMEVTLAASAAAGSTFAGWSGGGCSGTGSCLVTLKNAPTTVTATFDANPTSTPAPVPTPDPEGKAKASGTASVSGGTAALKLICSGGACKGALRLTAKLKQGKKAKSLVIGKASFNLADGASATLKVKLSGAAKNELAKGKMLRGKLSGTGIVASTVKLKPARHY